MPSSRAEIRIPPSRAESDHSLRATIVSRRKLRYRGGADSALDRPAHLRAGSSLSWLGERLAIVQDDANFVALVDPRTGIAEAVALPEGKKGLRQFDEAHGNKKSKLDLEACCVVPGRDGPRLIALGSGSTKRRRRVAILDQWDEDEPRVSLVGAEALYRILEDSHDFSGSDMNIEGALALPHALRLFSRGNGEARKGRLPLNSTCEISLPALLAYFASPKRASPPAPTSIRQYELGHLAGVALGFTDATLFGDAVLYTAAAEESPEADEDGNVIGSVLGVLPSKGAIRYTPLTDKRGAATGDKIEGVAMDHESTDRVFVVTDSDDAARPSELCEVRLDGSWR